MQANLLVGVAVVEEVKMQGVAGWSERELARVRGRLVEFASEMFASMRRKDQRRWGEVYVRGLMLDGKRKSIEPMVARLPDGDEQCLQQFVNQSPWDPVAVRRALAVRMSREIAPEAWVNAKRQEPSMSTSTPNRTTNGADSSRPFAGLPEASAQQVQGFLSKPASSTAGCDCAANASTWRRSNRTCSW